MFLSTMFPTQDNDNQSWFRKSKRQVILKAEGESLTLPVTPARYQVTTAQHNKTYDILDFGEALIFGNAKLKRLKFSGFFPSLLHDYPFIVGDHKPPQECVDLIIKWKEAKSPVRVIITDSPINHAMAINEFDFEEKDGTNDIYYKFTFVEYKDLNTPPANNEKVIEETTGLRERPEEESKWTSTEQIEKTSDDVIEAFKREEGCWSGFNFMRLECGDYTLDSEAIMEYVLAGSVKY